jgi:DNA-binding winged helix-turn-helix (wHTH) protein/tetratricopeptide (TPR) repeat protein
MEEPIRTRVGSVGKSVGNFHLGEWLVEPSLNRLSRGGENVHIRLKLMDVLGFLAQHAGQVVSNEEIIAAVWAREFMAESVLTRSIAELRQLLGDHASEPRFIETVTKRGYRLVAAVEWVHEATPVAARARRKRMVWLAAGSAAVVLTAAIIFLWQRANTVKPAGSLNPHLAVVAVFENRTGDTSLNPIGRMAAHRISVGLIQAQVVRVVPSSTVIRLDRDRPVTAQSTEDPVYALAEATRAGIVVSGAYFLSGHEVLIQAQINDAIAGTNVYQMGEASAPRGDPIEAIETARGRLVDAIAARYLNSAFDFLSWEPNPPSLAAYRRFLVGRELFGVDNPSCAAHLSRALELDPDFVMPRIYLSGVCWIQGDYLDAGRYLDVLEKKREHLTPVYRRLLDSRRAMLAGRWEESVNALREASRLAPTSALFAYQRGVEAVFANHPREAAEVLASSLDWGPIVSPTQAWGFWYFRYLTTALHMLGEHEHELAEAIRGIAVYPDELYLCTCEVRALAALGRLEDVDRVIARSLAMASRFETPGGVMVEAALELREHGYREASLRIANEAMDWYRNKPVDESASVATRRPLPYCLFLAERWEEARSAYAELTTRNPEDLSAKRYLGVLAALRGDRVEAQRISEELRRVERPYLYGEPRYCRACIAAELGERDRAVALLRESFAQGKRFDLYLHRDPDLEPLRGYPPFEELIKAKD